MRQLALTSLQKPWSQVYGLPQSVVLTHGAPCTPRCAEHFVAGEKMVPVQNGALEQHWLALVQPLPATRQAGAPQTPLLQARPEAQSPVSMHRWPLEPAVRWQEGAAPAVAPRQKVALAQHSLKVLHAMPTQEVITPASGVVVPASVPASTGVTEVWQRPPWQERPEQQSLVLVQVTLAPPQLARHRSEGAVVVPRQLGYAAQHPPLTYDAVQTSPDAHTRMPPSARTCPASAPASTAPASTSSPASDSPASDAPASRPASSGAPPSLTRITHSVLLHCSPRPQTSQAPLLPQASSVLPGWQVLPSVQPEQLVVPLQNPSWHSWPGAQDWHSSPEVPHENASLPGRHRPSSLQHPLHSARQSLA